MKSHGEAIEYQRIVEKVLRSLPKKFESLVVKLEANKMMSQFTIHELQASFINKEHKINISDISLEGVFAPQPSISSGRGRGRGTSVSKGGCNNNPTNVVDRGNN